MWRRLYKNSPPAAVVTVFGASLFGMTADCEKQAPQDVAVYLTPASKQAFTTHLSDIGVKGHVDTSRVVLRRSCQPNDYFEYEPLFGERVAFRLKGIVRTDSGLVAGTGRLSTLAGELKDDHVEPSIPLQIGKPEEIVDGAAEACTDLPTRIVKANVANGKPYWKGRLVGGTVLDKHYSAEKASFVSLSLDRQIVVDGYLCGSKYVDGEGNCTFDRARDMQVSKGKEEEKEQKKDSIDDNVQKLTNDKAEKESSKDTDNTKNPEEESECPVCRFMKGGPCRAQFEGWDGCVQGLSDSEDLAKCFDVTMKMMECMRKHEYYDVMTAGTDEKFKAAQSATAEAAAAAAAAPSPKSES